jgi:hypothetical protein
MWCPLTCKKRFCKRSVVGTIHTSILSHWTMVPRLTPVVAGCHQCSVHAGEHSDVQLPTDNLWKTSQHGAVLYMNSSILF